MIDAQTVAGLKKEFCTGCGVCANVCPQRCISMKADEEGFLYPSIDALSCNSCGKCVTFCPVMHPPTVPADLKEPFVCAAWSLDDDVRYNSTSGGVFTELAKAVLQQKGFVCGARYNSRHLVEHAIIDREEDIALLRRSKYVQSEAKDIYRKVGTAVQTGKPVLFVGTPCQCAGLKVFLNKPYDNLFLCDFICRGVNSPKVYLKYLEELEEQYGSRVKQVWFKNKTFGWNRFCTKVLFEDGQEYLGGRDTDPFMYGYIKKGLNLYMRPSCGQCRFKGIKRSVDITLGDFWGLKIRDTSDSSDFGVSVFMLHSDKSKRLLEIIKRHIYYEKHSLEDILPFNACLRESAERNSTGNAFWESLRGGRFFDVMKNLKEQRE